MRNSRLAGTLLIAISLLVATLMVSANHWTASAENKRLAVLFLIAAWWGPYSWLAAKRSKCNC